MMLDQLWFSIRIIKTTLLESIPVAESFGAPAKMQNRAITGTTRFFMPSSTLRTVARPEKKRSEGRRRASKITPPPDLVDQITLPIRRKAAQLARERPAAFAGELLNNSPLIASLTIAACP